jgi:hypothetical protein
MRILDEYNFIDARDYLLLPVFLFLLILLAMLGSKNYNPANRKLFVIVFSCKLLFAVIYAMVYQYYYKGGDTSYYFSSAVNLNAEVKGNLWLWFKMVFYPFNSLAIERQFFTTISPAFLDVDVNYFPVRLASLINVFTFNTYINTSLVFSAISFIGIWRNFIVFEKLYPTLRKQFIISFLFLPSVLFWASGISKDTICYGAFTLFTSYFLQIYLLKEHTLKNFFWLFISALIILAIKPYIL